MSHYKVPDSAVGQRLDVWLSELLQLPRSQVQRLIKSGHVTAQGASLRASYSLRKGDSIDVAESLSKVATRPELDLPIIYQDDEVVVIDKPAGLTVHPARADSQKPTVVDFVRRFTDDPNPDRPGIVHRLDSDTSGVLILARTVASKEALQAEFRHHRVQKTYVALVVGRLKPEAAVIRLPLGRSSNDLLKRVPTPGGREAETTYRVLEEFDGFSLIEAQPKTGRTHQIRAHMAAIGHPIAGDKRYGGVPLPNGLKRQFLHATRLLITLPSGRSQKFESSLAPDLALVLEQLRRPSWQRV
jgi:23S rRNA pseudouridine1911/1915/1917 synthase